MKLIFISVLFISIRYVFSAKDKGMCFELDNLPKEAYLFSDEECNKIYICKSRNKGILGISDDIYNCFYRSGQVDGKFGAFDRIDPDQCMYKGRVTISGPCYYDSNGKDKIIDKLNSSPTVRFYDIDNNHALTEYGCCSYSRNDDASWMEHFFNRALHINEINIPGTHDSGTYDVQESGLGLNIIGAFADSFRKWWAKTQNLDIYEQLLHGIRYFDIRLETNKDKEIYLTHEKFDCTNKKTGKKNII